MEKIINHGLPHIAEQIFDNINTDGLIQLLKVSKTWEVLAENVLLKRWKGKMLKACQQGESKVVQLLLEHCTAEESGLNTKDEHGGTSFMWACRNGHKDVVKLLLNHSERIELNARNNYGWTAFIEACYYGHKDVIQLLLDNFERIELNATDKCGFTGLMIAHRRGHQDIVQMIKSRTTGVTFLPCFWAFICSLFLIRVAAAIGLFSDEFYVKLHLLL